MSSNFEYLKFGLVFEHEPVALLGDGLFAGFGRDALAHLAGFETTVYSGQDHNGRFIQRKRKQVRGDELILDDHIESSALDLNVPVIHDVMPVFTSSVQRLNIAGCLPFAASWSILAEAFNEEWFVQRVLTQIETLIQYGECYGFGGPDYEAFGAEPGSSLRRYVEAFHWIDYRSSIAGVHWINLVPSHIITPRISSGLESLGVRVRDGNGVTVIQLADTPSDVTDELVADCMEVCSEIVSPLIQTNTLPPDWWRQKLFS